MSIMRIAIILLRAILRGRVALAAENLLFRHQLGILQRSVKRPRLRNRDRILWVWLSQLWADWWLDLIIVKPVKAKRAVLNNAPETRRLCS